MDCHLLQSVTPDATTLPLIYPKHTVGDIEYGRASGLTLAHAKEGAARIALRALLFESFRQRQRQG